MKRNWNNFSALAALFTVLLLCAFSQVAYSSCAPGVDAGCKTWYQDADGDGYGVASVTMLETTHPAGYAAASGDCDDTNATKHLVDPDLAAPSGTNIVRQPYFIWENKSPGTVEWYNIEVWGAGGSCAGSEWFEPASICTGAFCIAQLSHTLRESDTFWWWVNTWGNNSCNWQIQPGGKFLKFTVASCAGPILISPKGDTFAPKTKTIVASLELAKAPESQLCVTAPVTKPTFTFTDTGAEWYNIQVWTSAGYLALNQWEDAAQQGMCIQGTCSKVSTNTFPAGTTNWWWLNTWSQDCGFQMQPGGHVESFTVTP